MPDVRKTGEFLIAIIGELPEVLARAFYAPLYVSLPIILLFAAFAYWRPAWGFGFYAVFFVGGLLSSLFTKGASLFLWVPFFPFVTYGIAIGIVAKFIRRALS